MSVKVRMELEEVDKFLIIACYYFIAKGGGRMQNKILIVDDETDIVTMLRDFFEGKGYFVLAASNGKDAVAQAEKQPDVILLDINMPEADGFSVCRRIRDYISCPILFLTAKIEDADKVKGFAAGGDDYITKPFSLVELEARVSAHLRREVRRRKGGKIKFSDSLSIDYADRNVTHKNQTVNFSKKEFDIIELLSQNAGQVFDKERIYEAVWGYDGEGDGNVVVEHIRRIRAKFADAGCGPTIETVWGCGYKWVK